MTELEKALKELDTERAERMLALDMQMYEGRCAAVESNKKGQINALWDERARAHGYDRATHEFICGEKHSEEANRIREEVSTILRDKSGMPQMPVLSDYFLYEKLWNNC